MKEGSHNSYHILRQYSTYVELLVVTALSRLVCGLKFLNFRVDVVNLSAYVVEHLLLELFYLFRL